MTRSPNFWRGLSTALAVSTALLPTACARTDLAASGRARGEASVTREALELARPRMDLPPLPGDCAGRERSGVREGDRLDAALVKSDAAIARANERVRRCAAWYGEIRASHGGEQEPWSGAAATGK